MLLRESVIEETVGIDPAPDSHTTAPTTVWPVDAAAVRVADRVDTAEELVAVPMVATCAIGQLTLASTSTDSAE